MGVLYVVASYAFFYYVGELLMRLVVVQPLSGASAVRWCFANTFALSLSLFSAVLVDIADASILQTTTSASASPAFVAAVKSSETRGEAASVKPASWPLSMVLLAHSLFQVSAQSFMWLMLLLLSTVLVICPTLLVFSVFRHTFCRRRRAVVGRCSRAQNVQGYGGALRGHGGGNLCSGRSGSRSPSRFFFSAGLGDTERSRGLRAGRRGILVGLLVVSFLCAGVWLVRTGQLSPQVLRQVPMVIVRHVHTLLHRVAAVLNVPQEIEVKRSSASSRGPLPFRPHTESVLGRKTPAEDVSESLVGVFVGPLAETTAGAPGEGDGMAAQPQLQMMPRYRFPVTDAMHAAPTSIAAGLHAFVCAVTSRVATVGVAMIGLLSGYAAITSPCLFLAPYMYWRGREEELVKAQLNFNKKLRYVLDGYGAVQRQIATLEYSVLHEESSPQNFSVASSPTLAPRYPLHPSGHKPTGYGRDSCDAPLSANCSRYPGSHTSSGTGAYSLKDRSWADSDLGKSSGFVYSSALPHVAQEQAELSAMGWCQKKLRSVAHVFVGGTSEDSRDGCLPRKNLTSTEGNPALSRQRAVARISTLRSEAAASRYLSLSMYLQMSEVMSMVREAQRGSTWVGRWYAGLGAAMAVYSIIKIALTVASLWLFKASTQDPVTRAVSLLEGAFILRRRDTQGGVSFSVTAVEVSTHVILALALVVNAWMVVSSVRGALLALFHVTMSFSGSAISRPETISVGLSMMIGVYFIGQLVMLRSSLPGIVPSPLDGVSPSAGTVSSNVLVAVLGSLPYYYYQRLSDSCFLVGCCGAIIMRCFVLRDAVSSIVYTASGGE